MFANDFLCFPDGKTKALTFSYDDGQHNDRELIALFNKYNVKGTFNLNSGNLGTGDRVTKEEIATTYKGHEVAVHTVTHPFLEKLPSNIATKEVIEDKENLEELCGYVVRGMAYPFGTYNDNVVEILEKCGIKYSRTVEAHRQFKIPTDWLRMPSTCHHADEKLFELAEKFTSGDPQKMSFNQHGWLFYVWGHSYEFREKSDWDRMEKFVSMVANREDVWYATNIEIYDYIKAFEQLEYSNDLSMIYNPSAINVFLIREGKTYEVKSGETLKI